MARQAKVTIECDTDELATLLAELSDIARELRFCGVDIPEFPAEPFRVEQDDLSTLGAPKVMVRFKPSDSLLEFAATLRALDGD